jgi:hypothetical protein
MEISRTATGILALVCVAAGAGGTFLAVRNDTPPVNAEALAAPETASGAAVAESEAIIADVPAVHEAPTTTAAPGKPVPPPVPRPPRPVAPTPRAQQAKTISAPEVTETQGTVVPIEPPVITDNQASRSVDPPGPVYEELVVSADSVIGLQLESPITSERAQVEDSVVARVTRDVRVSDRVAIPSGARAFGEVTVVERGGRLRERARLGVRFTSIVLADGTRLPIHTETIFREGDAPGRESATKIGGGAIGGAIIGGLLGGAKGAAIGGSIGAGAGTAAVMADRNHAVIPAGSPLTVRLEDPVVVTVER